MSQETATIEKDLEIGSKKTTEGMAGLRSQRNLSGIPASGQNQPVAERSFGERLKNFFAHFAKSLEGDQESHKYRG